MNYRKLRYIENLILLMFPVSLIVACTTNGTDQTTPKNLTSSDAGYSSTKSENPYFKINQSDFVFTDALTQKASTGNEDMSWSVGEATSDQYVIVSPAMHLAIYKTTKELKQDQEESVQTADLIEPAGGILPGKSIFHYGLDAYNLDRQDLTALREHAEFLQNHPEFNLTVSGHTDRIGSAQYNQKLSEQRAQMVKDILITFGAPETQIVTDGYGETQPMTSADNLDENRRVELEYSRALMISRM